MPRLIDAAPPALLERDAELTLLREAVDASAQGQGRLVAIEGQPGIGKSSLLQAGLELAARHRLRSLQATAGELETTYPYGVPLDLFARAVSTDTDREHLLSGAAARVAPLLNGDSLPADGVSATLWSVAGHVTADGPRRDWRQITIDG